MSCNNRKAAQVKLDANAPIDVPRRRSKCGRGSMRNPWTHRCNTCKAFSDAELDYFAKLLKVPADGPRDEVCRNVRALVNPETFDYLYPSLARGEEPPVEVRQKYAKEPRENFRNSQGVMIDASRLSAADYKRAQRDRQGVRLANAPGVPGIAAGLRNAPMQPTTPLAPEASTPADEQAVRDFLEAYGSRKDYRGRSYYKTQAGLDRAVQNDLRTTRNVTSEYERWKAEPWNYDLRDGVDMAGSRANRSARKLPPRN